MLVLIVLIFEIFAFMDALLKEILLMSQKVLHIR